MTNRTPYPGNISPSDPVTDTNNNRLPGGWCVRLQSTTALTSFTTEADVPGCTSSAFTMSTSRVYKHSVSVTVSNSLTTATTGQTRRCVVKICDGSDAKVAEFSVHISQAASFDTVTGFFYEVGSGASEVRKLRVAFATDAGSVQAASTGCASSYMIEDVGSTT